ncbi:MAG: hypothetical protein JWQ40_1276 [Segetibacter sp.]|jgi:AcrR family transcriptional regulator|nr:hypothetical protein [Segetibacter sp.]
MKAEGSVKQEHILEAAIRRFSHFGINKTTLTEIADDLDISKPSLFYYFNDKNSLIAAVVGKIVNEFLVGFEAALQSAGSVEEGLLSLVEVKREYFRKYSLLAMQGDSVDMSKTSAAIITVFEQARTKSVALLSGLLQKGIEEGVLKPMDTKRTSNTLLDTLSAFEYCMKVRKSIPDLQEMEEIFDKQKDVLQMFLNGLKGPLQAGKEKN